MATAQNQPPKPDASIILAAARHLFDPGDVIELRALFKGAKRHTDSGFFDGEHWSDMAKTAARLNNDGAQVYVTINPTAPELLRRSTNRVESYVKSTVEDVQIVRRRWILIDIDPVRPAGISSTDDQVEAARWKSEACSEFLAERGFPDPTIAASGNGFHLLYPCDLPNDKESTDAIKSLLLSLAARFDDHITAIDRGVFNAARITKLYGTVARKGDYSDEAPWRLSKILNESKRDRLVSLEMIRSVAPVEVAPTKINGASHAPARSQFGAPFDVPAFIGRLGIGYVKDEHGGADRYNLDHCPFNPDHGPTESAIFQSADGKIGFRCFHNSCLDKKWADVRELVDGPRPVFEQRRNPVDNFVPDDLEPPPLGEPAKQAAIIPAKAISWPALEGKTPPDREWAIDHWLGIGHPTLCVGVGGIGKTLLTQQLGSCLSVGASFIGAVQRPLRVLMWGCEDDHDEFWRRQLRISAAMGRSISDFTNLVIAPRLGLDNTLITTEFGKPMWTPLIGELAEQVADLDADVVILDNMGQMFGAKDERHSVTMFINGVVGACQKRKPTAQILLAHPARAEGSEYSGSGAWENSVRMRWFFSNKLPDAPPDDTESADSDACRYLAKRKANYTSKDYVKFNYFEGTYQEESESLPSGFASNGDYRFAQAKRVVVDGIRKLAAMKLFASERPSATYLPKLLIDYKLADGLEKTILGSAMRTQMTDGIIARVVVGKMANRDPKYGLIVAEDWPAHEVKSC